MRSLGIFALQGGEVQRWHRKLRLRLRSIGVLFTLNSCSSTEGADGAHNIP